jgi:hypothetical protein
VSFLNGGSTGIQYCGAREYSLVSVVGSALTALSATEIKIDSITGLISVYTASAATIGTHTVTVKAKLTNYSYITSTLPSITVEIIGCVVTGFTMAALSPMKDKTYSIATTALTWSLVGSSITVQVPPCGYQQTLSSDIVPAFVTVIPGATVNYSVVSRDFVDSGSHTISVTSTLKNYNFSPSRPAPTCQSTFVLTSIDTCAHTVLSTIPVAVENLVAFSGYSVKSLL